MQEVMIKGFRMLAVPCLSWLLMGTFCPDGYSFAVISGAKISANGEVYLCSPDSIVVLSRDVGCRGTDPILIVSGQNITWYADSAKNVRLAQGNTYHSASLDATTTFYLTQNIDGIESPVQAIIIEIVDPFLLDVQITPASCGKKDGTITIFGKGGTTRYPLNYKLDNGPLQTSPFFPDLAGVNYKLTIWAAGCYGESIQTVGQQPSPVIAAIDSIHPKCGNNNGSIRIAAYSGSGALSYSLNGADFRKDYLYENLAGGAYTVTVRDDSLCTVSQPVFLKNSKKLLLNTIETTPASCGKPNGQIAVMDAAGNGKLTYSLTGRSDQASAVFDNLGPGSYEVSAQDEDGCSDTQTVGIANNEGPAITYINTQVPSCATADGRLTISAAGPGIHYYSLDGGPYQLDSTFAGLSAGKYTVTVKDDLNCTAEQSIDLGEPCVQQFYLPASFTPNHDGKNDGWAIFFPFASLQIQALTIYNRWGEVVFHSKPGSVTAGAILWDGVYKNGILGGLFTYELQVQLPSGKNHIYHGRVIAL